MNATAGEADLIGVVLADANVLYSRVLRDYLLYAADQEIIVITWSSQILAEASLKGATDESTVKALRTAGAPTTADLIARLIRHE